MTDSDNLPAVRTEVPSASVVRRDTDSWSDQLPAIVELARSICGTDFVPEALRDNVAATAAAILYGREIGLAPMTALSNVYVIKGVPALSARIQRAQVLAAGHSFRVVESNSARAVVEGRRRGDEGPWTRASYDYEEAKRAGLIKPRSAWETNAADMCFARASARLCRQIFTDVILGLPIPEELEEGEPDVTPASTTKVQRRTRRATQNGGPASPSPAATGDGPAADSPPPAGSSPPPVPLPGEPGYESGGGSEVGQGKALAHGSSSQTDDEAETSHGTGSGAGGRRQTAVPASPSLSSAGGSGVHAEASDATDGTAADRTSGTPRTGEPEPPADPDEAEIIDTAKPASKAILRALQATFTRLGFDKDDAQLKRDIVSAIAGEEVTTLSETTELSHVGARKATETLARLKSRADVVRLMKEIANAPDGEVPGGGTD